MFATFAFGSEITGKIHEAFTAWWGHNVCVCVCVCVCMCMPEYVMTTDTTASLTHTLTRYLSIKGARHTEKWWVFVSFQCNFLWLRTEKWSIRSTRTLTAKSTPLEGKTEWSISFPSRCWGLNILMRSGNVIGEWVSEWVSDEVDE